MQLYFGMVSKTRINGNIIALFHTNGVYWWMVFDINGCLWILTAVWYGLVSPSPICGVSGLPQAPFWVGCLEHVFWTSVFLLIFAQLVICPVEYQIDVECNSMQRSSRNSSWALVYTDRWTKRCPIIVYILLYIFFIYIYIYMYIWSDWLVFYYGDTLSRRPKLKLKAPVRYLFHDSLVLPTRGLHSNI